MGFFKRIGKGIGKGIKGAGKFIKKNATFKNLVSLASNFDPSGIVGGLQAKHEAKKQEQQALAEMQQNPEFNQLPATEQVMLVKNHVGAQNAQAIATASDIAQKRGITIGEVLQGAAGGALQGAGSVMAGDTKVATTGGTLTQNVFMNWLKRFWYIPLGIVVILALVWRKLANPQSGRTYRRR
ncbi:hypothetical protein SAMN05444377_10483 [Flavobacterium fontis]|uniref:Uncharacterized protein n=1 Tax=Flavobacterium fontis TaxID=1124188 RepID=A0A1M4Z8I2_9FLAO|nr:hypothetical protein [Flavobacterium fontis]SHF13967.1 hypothetical protein SAMN05444377_10471 [Flavobacterium fontis]SHF14330.1 hypothetical protein SAMN05444377_10483 [Flavobacterium fontis]